MPDATYSNEDLNRFWLNILADNALVISNSLSPQETGDVPQARALADKFDALALRANQSPSAAQTAQLNREAFQATQDLRQFFLHVLDSMLTSKYSIYLKAATINRFVDETEKYLSQLNAFLNNEKPVFDPIAEEIFWFPIFSLQNRYIADNLGYYQVQNRQRAQNLANYLSNYEKFSMVLREISRIGTQDFPLAREHHIATTETLNTYYGFLNNLVNLHRERELPGSMSLLYLDRARRMLCFYLQQMNKFLGTKAPDCDPFAKRISSF